jgi:2-polyprenyl-3-methyl-5-hydroxy-6-metoxy-1,4-benzoquinol methylase
MTQLRDFDTAAATWDEEPRRVKLAEDMAAAIAGRVPLSKSMTAIDYGCGTGLLTLLIQTHVGRIIGADSSKGMLEVLERKVRDRGLGNVDTLLIDAGAEGPAEERVHLLTCHMTLHHVEDIPALFRRFHEMLLPGGILCLSDLDAEDGSFHSDATGVFFHGFDRDNLRALLADAGFTDIRDTTASVIKKKSDEGEREYPVFLITAREPRSGYR